MRKGTTYKQTVERLRGELQSVYKRLGEVSAENDVRKLALENNENTFDPVVFHDAVNKLQTCIDGLTALKSIAEVGSSSWVIATEVLLQIEHE